MRQEVAAFAGLMERKLSDNDHKGGWHSDTPEDLLVRLKEETKELEKELRARPLNSATAALEAVDIANFAMMIADRLTNGKLGELPRALKALPMSTRGSSTTKKRAFRWLIVCQGDDARVMSGKVHADSDDEAMVAVRGAAVLDQIARPFEITIARLYRVADETIQKTAEVTE